MWYGPCFWRMAWRWQESPAPPTQDPVNTDLMSHQLVIDLTRDAILTALTVSAPMLLIALGVGLIVSVFQSVTQIQEQTLAFVPKLVLVGGAFVVGLPWLIQVLVRYTKQLIMSIPSVVS